MASRPASLSDCILPLPDQVCGLEEVEKCRWVVRNENKQVEEKVCNFIDKKVSFVTFDYV